MGKPFEKNDPRINRKGRPKKRGVQDRHIELGAGPEAADNGRQNRERKICAAAPFARGEAYRACGKRRPCRTESRPRASSSRTEQ